MMDIVRTILENDSRLIMVSVRDIGSQPALDYMFRRYILQITPGKLYRYKYAASAIKQHDRIVRTYLNLGYTILKGL